MKARLAAAVAFTLLLPAVAVAGETPWSELKKLFHEPVRELKQQFNQMRDEGQAKAKPRQKAQPPAEVAKQKAPEKAPTVVIPPVKPETLQSETAKIEAPTPEASAPEAPEPAVAKAEAPKAEAPKTKVEAAKAEVAKVEEAPIPRPRPEITFSYAPDASPLPPEKPAYAAIVALTPPGRSLIVPSPAAKATCTAALVGLGVEASSMAPVDEGGCGIAQPVAVASLDGGGIDLTTKAIIECNLAETFANWIRDEVQPEARKILGGEIVGLRVAASYTCRPRNNVKGAKLSEHGKGNAIDIAAFNVSGHGWITVAGSHKGDEARFLKVVRSAACDPFTTVLGPGSDAYHSDHFHLDLAQRRKNGPSKGLYCK